MWGRVSEGWIVWVEEEYEMREGKVERKWSDGVEEREGGSRGETGYFWLFRVTCYLRLGSGEGER